MMAITEQTPTTEDIDNALTIGELARTVGVSPRTIRYYEELGILPPPPRTPLGTRLYPPPWKFYLEGALALKGLGFKLNEIALVGQLALGTEISPQEREQALQVVADHMQDLEQRIRVLRAIKRGLTDGVGVARSLGKIMEEASPPPAAT